jgi:SAM-dependent methyltransferase
VALSGEFTDPRLVALYDTVCPPGPGTDFYLELAAELRAPVIVDIGCGTGQLTAQLALQGHRMIGVDPSEVMLEVARTRTGGELVQWIEGDAGQLAETEADLVTMTGHVAQLITDDAGWAATLGAAHRALRGGGRLAFESRDPRVQPWAAGQVYVDRRQFEDPVAGTVVLWQRLLELRGDLARYELHYLVEGNELVTENELRFRSQAELSESLRETGFSVEHVYGDWNRSPVGAATPEMIFVAKRR